MRVLLRVPAVILLLLVGCGIADSGATKTGEQSPTQPPLHSDTEVKALTGYDPDALAPGADAPYLVVPIGETKKLGDVLNALRLEAPRLREPRVHVFNLAVTMAWRISPSFDLVYCLGGSDDDPDDPDPDDPKDLNQKVYGVQIEKRDDMGGWRPWPPK